MIDTPTEPGVRPRPTEFAPSELRADEPTFARVVGLVGLGLSVLGAAAVIAKQYGTGWIAAGVGGLFLAVGQAALLYHALRDGDYEVRRAYTALAYLLLAVFVLAAVGSAVESEAVAGLLRARWLPVPLAGGWAALPGLLGLGYLLAALRHETDDRVRNYALAAMLGIGGVLAVGSVLLGVVRPDTLAGAGAVTALLGLAFLAAFLSNTDTADGPGYAVAVLLGVLGGAAVAYAVFRSVAPTVLYDGPAAVKDAYQRYDPWKVGARVAFVLASLGAAWWAARNRGLPGWLRAATAAVFVGFAGLLAVAAVVPNLVTAQPTPYLVPGGLLMLGVGLTYLAVSLGAVADNPFVTLTRRELAGYFYSPIAYIVLLAMGLIEWGGYWIFAGVFTGGGPSAQEPILRQYVPGTIFGPLAVLFLVPALTMRLYSEEKRSGAMEVLLTAPVGEPTIVLSKLFGCWVFYLLCWVPMGLYLIALRAEGGQPFDYRPLLSLYVAVAVSGLAFVAIGGFFSSLTNNQIVAGMLTFVAMLALFALYWQQYLFTPPAFLKGVLEAVAVGSYWRLWQESLGGQLPVRDLLVQASMAVLFGFLTVKSLVSRKWG
jgi:hypothetical protein